MGVEARNPELDQVECILCQENHRDLMNHPWGIVSLISESSLVCYREDERGFFCRCSYFQVQMTSLPKDSFDVIFNSCGHTMHHSCIIDAYCPTSLMWLGYEKHMVHLAEQHDSFEQFEGDYLDVPGGRNFCLINTYVQAILFVRCANTFLTHCCLWFTRRSRFLSLTRGL